MPAERLPWPPRKELLTADELVRLASIGVRRLGTRSIRLTGGEPTLRPDLANVVAKAVATLVTPDRRRAVIARLGRLAMTRGRLPVRTWLQSSSKVTSRTQGSLLSTVQWPQTASPRSAGPA